MHRASSRVAVPFRAIAKPLGQLAGFGFANLTRRGEPPPAVGRFRGKDSAVLAHEEISLKAQGNWSKKRYTAAIRPPRAMMKSVPAYAGASPGRPETHRTRPPLPNSSGGAIG